MTISSRNIFDYDSMLTKKRQLNVRELRVRTKERDLISQALTQRNTEDDSQSRLIRAQRFFELGFEEGFTRAQTGTGNIPDVAGLFSIFSESLTKGNVRAKGGFIRKNETYLVGEEGPELIRSDENAVVVPNDKLNTLNNNRNGRRNKTLVMPIVQKQVQPVAVPTPTNNSNIIAAKVMRMNAKNLPSNIARLIR